MIRHFSAALAAALALGLIPTPGEFVPSGTPPDLPDLTAEAWVVYDMEADVVMASQRADEERPMASVTKVMTALVVRDQAALDQRVRVSEAAAAVGESEIGLVPGERWSVMELLQAMLVRSGNDAAVALAEHVGGDVAGFAALMNEKARDLGLNHSSFTNPHGLDEEDHYTSAADLTAMAAELLRDPVLATIVRTRLIRFRPAPDGSDRIARNTNKLLGVYPGVVGMKTGFTGDAGKVLISVIDTGDRRVIGVVMGSEDHFADSRELMAYGTEALTLNDRMASQLVGEEGGGTPSNVGVGGLQSARVEAVAPLPDGRWATTQLRGTDLGQRIEAWLRDLAPIIAGGTP